MKRSTALKENSLRACLVLLAALQIAGSITIYSCMVSDVGLAIPTPSRLALVFLIQAAAIIAVASMGHWSFHRRAYAAAMFTTVCCVSLYFLYQPNVAGKHVDLELIRQRVEGLIVIVNSCCFAVLNLLFAARLTMPLGYSRSGSETAAASSADLIQGRERDKSKHRNSDNPYQSPQEM